MHREIWIVIGLLASLVAGCHEQKAQMVAEPVVVVEYTRGNALAETPAKTTDRPLTTEIIESSASALLEMPAHVMEPFASRAQLVTGPGTSPIRAIPEGLSSVRFGQDRQAFTFETSLRDDLLGTHSPFVKSSAALTTDMTTRIKSALFELLIERVHPELLRLGILKRETKELALIDIKHASGQPLRLAIVLPQDGPGAIAYLLTVRPALDDAEAKQALAQIKPPAEEERPPTSEQLMARNTLQIAAEKPRYARAALVYLAGQGQASICEDAVLAGDDSFLSVLRAELQKKFEDPKACASLTAIGWTMDSCAFDLMGRMQLEQKLAPGLTAVLLMHAGEVGRSGASLEQVMGKAANRTDLENRLIAENFIYLEDVSPAARVRAYDWLLPRGKAPENYDPLASVAQRKKAMDAAIEKMSQENEGKAP